MFVKKYVIHSTCVKPKYPILIKGFLPSDVVLKFRVKKYKSKNYWKIDEGGW